MQEGQVWFWVEKIVWRTKWQPTIVFLPGKSYKYRSLEGYSTQGHKTVRYDLVNKQQHIIDVDYSVQFGSVVQTYWTLCKPMDYSTPGLPVHHQLPESTQTHVRCVSDAIQLSHSLLSPSPPVLNLSQLQRLFKWVSSQHQVAKVLEFQLQHQSFQWIFRTDFL